MYYRKIASNLRVTCGANGAIVDLNLDPVWGGHTMKQVNFQIDVRQKSSTTAMAGLKLKHGPNGDKYLDHSTPIASTILAGAPDLLNGDSDPAKMLGEVLLPVVTIASNAAQMEWATVDVYMVAKPF